MSDNITAYGFARPLTKKGFTFGVDAKAAAASLRELADRIERDAVALQEARVYSVASHAAFTLTTVVVKIAEPCRRLSDDDVDEIAREAEAGAFAAIGTSGRLPRSEHGPSAAPTEVLGARRAAIHSKE